MGVELQEDLRRKMIDLNLCEAFRRQSKQTGYVHYHYLCKESRDTIPLLENFCFVLALFRSRNTEHLAEGKSLLEKLLVFEVEGNFPLYLHEYPQCKDRDLGLDILPVLHWLLQEFTFALGSSLSLSIQKCISRILAHGYAMDAQRPLCPSRSFRLKSYFEPASVVDWVPRTAEEWAHGLITCQISNLKRDLLSEAVANWDKNLSLYKGKQDQEGQEPKVTLLDLLLGYHYSSYPKRLLNAREVHLQASLVYPFSGSVSEEMCEESSWVLSDPQTIHWGTLEQLHSLQLEAKLITTSVYKEGLTWSVTLSEPEERDTIELSLFLNTLAFQSLHVQGLPATTFQLEDILTLSLQGIDLQIQITLEEGEGRFFGHFLRGNRSCQKAKGPYLGEDWQIALRTLCRSPQCKLKVSLTLQKKP